MCSHPVAGGNSRSNNDSTRLLRSRRHSLGGEYLPPPKTETKSTKQSKKCKYKLPMAEELFPKVSLSGLELNHYLQTCGLILNRTCQEFFQSSSSSNPFANWKLIKEKNDLRVYRCKQDTDLPMFSHLQIQSKSARTMMCVGYLHGTLHEVMDGLYAETTQESRTLQAILNPSTLLDSAVLYTMPKSSESYPQSHRTRRSTRPRPRPRPRHHHPRYYQHYNEPDPEEEATSNPYEAYEFGGVIWLAVKTAGPSFINNRDVCAFKRMGTFQDQDGSRVGYHVLQSIQVPQWPEMKWANLVRANVSIGCIFKPIKQDLIQVFMYGDVDPKGSMPSYLADLGFATTFLSISNSSRSGQAKKFTQLLASSHLPREDHLTDAISKVCCELCGCKSSWYSLDRIDSCRGCCQRVCANCRAKKDIFCSPSMPMESSSHHHHHHHHHQVAGLGRSSNGLQTCQELFCLKCICHVAPTCARSNAKLIKQQEKKRKQLEIITSKRSTRGLLLFFTSLIDHHHQNHSSHTNGLLQESINRVRTPLHAFAEHSISVLSSSMNHSDACRSVLMRSGISLASTVRNQEARNHLQQQQQQTRQRQKGESIRQKFHSSYFQHHRHVALQSSTSSFHLDLEEDSTSDYVDSLAGNICSSSDNSITMSDSFRRAATTRALDKKLLLFQPSSTSSTAVTGHTMTPPSTASKSVSPVSSSPSTAAGNQDEGSSKHHRTEEEYYHELLTKMLESSHFDSAISV